MEQYYYETAAQTDYSKEDQASLGKWNSLSSVAKGTENSQSGGFDCNICLDLVQDPVVTLCGHLYCWPCIYKWIHLQSGSAENPDQPQPQCPVCKAEVSEKTLVPLYGRGRSTKSVEGKAPNLGIVIPRRPPSPNCGVRTLITTTNTTSSRSAQELRDYWFPQQPRSSHSHTGGHSPMPMLSLGGTTTASLLHPQSGVFGEMVYARIFGNSETTSYAYPNSYYLAGTSSPRVRRHVMQAHKSLSRILFFLCCCVALCLLLF